MNYPFNPLFVNASTIHRCPIRKTIKTGITAKPTAAIKITSLSSENAPGFPDNNAKPNGKV